MCYPRSNNIAPSNFSCPYLSHSRAPNDLIFFCKTQGVLYSPKHPLQTTDVYETFLLPLSIIFFSSCYLDIETIASAYIYESGQIYEI